MAKLPTVASFGPRPTPRSGRAIHSVRGGIAADAAARGFNKVSDAYYELWLKQTVGWSERNLPSGNAEC